MAHGSRVATHSNVNVPHRDALAFVLVALLASALLFGLRELHAGRDSLPMIEVDKNQGEVRIVATIHPTAMSRPFGVRGHHAIVWKGGRAARWALFRSEASDHEVRMALASLKLKPGENLTAQTWTDRKNPKSPEPDKRVEGPGIDVLIRFADGTSRPLSELIEEREIGTPDLDFRYGGNERFQPLFKSGCIVCLYSCPGGAIGDHNHTIRDYEHDGAVFSARKDRLPPSGSRATIILKPRLEAR